MLPGMGGMDPKKMQAMMKQLGLKQEEVEARRVIFERDEGNIIIENPSIQRIEMRGNVSWQVSGEARDEVPSISMDDIKLIMEKTGSSEKEARDALEETGDLAEAIVKLS